MKRKKKPIRLYLMTKSGLALLLLCSLAICGARPLWAKPAKDSVKVRKLDPAYPAEKLEMPGVKLEKPANPLNIPPYLQKTEQTLKQAGLANHVKGWDEFEKDLLLMRSRSLTSAEMHKLYPKLPPKKLKALNDAIKSTQ